ncbi:Uncharacterised protein family (UPF0158) [Halobacillus alkaliphilus]|uniref:Uncharacterized protein family (UPF0158) n=1 Tax=Halobacillus alkaliphilus TaxID=396056 RepID=A0A1I2M3Z6_9BACI|nr:UPF0158 family protein [Halobacillus alkaliphilus]SFF86175.1 Uncharacterised protein family (UPF0158) [Halobacillus alkaliphilus]
MNQVDIREVADAIEVQVEGDLALVDKIDGKIVHVSDEAIGDVEEEEDFDHLLEWQREERHLAQHILENETRYIQVPDCSEVDEYQMMEAFINSLQDDQIHNDLLRAIRGKGAFRRFKDQIVTYGVGDQWYEYKDEQYRSLAIEWCEENNIPYKK